MFWLISSDVRVHVESFLVVAVDNTSNGVFDVSPTVGLEGCLAEVILVFGVRQGPCVGLQLLNVLLNLFQSFFLFLSLFFPLPFPYLRPYFNILTLLLAFLTLGFSRFRPLSRVERSILAGVGWFIGNWGLIEFGLVDSTLSILLGIEGNILFLL